MPERTLARSPRRFAPIATVFVAAALCATVTRVGARAATDAHIHELLVGANGASRVQYIVIAQEAAGQNAWGPGPNQSRARARLRILDVHGRETAVWAFPTDPGTGGSLLTLLGTADYAALPGVPAPDVIIPPLLPAGGGRVCFESTADVDLGAHRRDCVTFGAYAGASEENLYAGGTVAPGPAAPGLGITGAVALRRASMTGRNSDFELAAPAPTNLAGVRGTMSPADLVRQGAALFSQETFAGNGRTCATCHAPEDSFGLRPATVQRRFGTVAATYDPLFVAEQAPSAFDAGFDFGINRLVLTAPVVATTPCTGRLQGTIMDAGGGRGRILAQVSATEYLVGGGLAPRLTGRVTDGICAGDVARMVAGDVGAVPGATLPGLEDPRLMRTSTSADLPNGRALFLENVDGLNRPPVFRKSPHLLNLRLTGPFGFSGDVDNLRTFSLGAVTQHFPRTLARSTQGTDPDFRVPTLEELAALEAFMLAQEFPRGADPDKFNLDRFITTAAQRRGRDAFFGNQAKCSRCHGGPVLAATTVPIQGRPVGINASFNTGVTRQAINGPGGDNLPCEPADPSLGTCGSREFSVPQLFNVANLTPLFHDGSAATVRDAVDFYDTRTFNDSPAGRAIGGINMPANMRRDITAFLEALVVPAPAPVIAAHPANAAVTAGTTLVLDVALVDPSAATFQWQWSDDGTSWSDAVDAGDQSGAQSPTYTVRSTPASWDRRQYRLIARNTAGQATSWAATIRVFGAVSTSPASLRFATRLAATAAAAVTTSPQVVNITHEGAASAWSVTSTAQWIHVDVQSGDGNGAVTVTATPPAGLPAGTQLSAALAVVPGRAGLATWTIPVTLDVVGDASNAVPFGQVDTPVQDHPDVTGAVAVTGWALDDVGVTAVELYRSCVPSDSDTNCVSIAGIRGVFVADAAFADGARPDVAAAYAQWPNAARSGWGAVVLTNALPNVVTGSAAGGEGPISLYAIARDGDGGVTVLGRTVGDHTATRVTLRNSTLARPFGALDSPAPGATVRGTIPVFGWALTPDADTAADSSDIFVPEDGRTIVMFVDGQPVGTVSYGQCRGTVGNPVPEGAFCNDDVASTFGWPTPQTPFSLRSSNATRFRNLDAGRGAIGAVWLDTTVLADGRHTLAWSVTDSAGRTEGIGSRFFTVDNGRLSRDTAGARRDLSRVVTPALTVRSGFDLAEAWRPLVADDDLVFRLRMPVQGRVEVRLPRAVTGLAVTPTGTEELPAGARLQDGTFTWAPPPGFLGTFPLAFITDTEETMRIEVTIAPPDTASPAVFVDRPSPGLVPGDFVVEGWAHDFQAVTGSGVGAVHVWARRVDAPGHEALFLGDAQLGVHRPDVSDAAGGQAANAGWRVGVHLEPGTYDVTAYVWLWRTRRWEDARTIRVVVER